MSLIRPILNTWLRYTEKPSLARATDPKKIRASFERKARLFFRGPKGCVYQREEIAGVPVMQVTARDVTARSGPLLLYLHGGGYVFGSARAYQALAGQLSERTGLAVCVPDYRKAPEHPFPAAIEDATDVYKALADHPCGIILGGDSAGGSLSLGLCLEAKRLELPMPLGCFCFSPLTDLSLTFGSVTRNAETEVVLPVSMAQTLKDMILQGAPEDDPRISPIHGDFSGLEPVWITVSDTEILLDDSREIAARLKAQGVETTLRIERDLPHVWPIFHNILPEARNTLNEVAAWISALPRRQADS